MLDKLKMVLQIIGAVALGLPALLTALDVFLLALPGKPGDTWIHKIMPYVQQAADLLSKLLGITPKS